MTRMRPPSKRRMSSTGTLVSCVAAFSLSLSSRSLAFQPSSSLASTPAFVATTITTRLSRATTCLYSSVGGGNEPPRNNDDGDAGKSSDWDDFLNPNHEESDSMQKAREYMSENSLPISFDMIENNTEEEEEDDDDDNNTKSSSTSSANNDPSLSSALVGPGGGGGRKPGELLPGSPSDDVVARNPYMAVVSKLSPSDLISKFTSQAHPSVQNAVRTTILGLIGGLPKLAFDTTTITTGQRLASLMFQLQMTGYMFKNAEYKLSMQQALGVKEEQKTRGKFLLKTSHDDDDDNNDDEDTVDPLKGKIRGKLRVRYGKKSGNEQQGDETASDDAAGGVGEIEVDAAAYMSELRSEVSKLRDELMITRKTKEEALRKDLLMYIRTLPERELRELTNTMSQDVLVAMKGLVNAVMSGIGEGKIEPDTVTEQSGEAMAQLCMWQLAIGYNLRTLEVREEMKRSLSGDAPDEGIGGIDLSGPGALE